MTGVEVLLEQRMPGLMVFVGTGVLTLLYMDIGILELEVMINICRQILCEECHQGTDQRIRGAIAH